MSLTPAPRYYEYAVKPQDTLSHLVFTFYGFGPGSAHYRSAQEFLLSLNPEIKNSDRIEVGQILRVAEYAPPSIFTRAHRPHHLLDTLQDPLLLDVLGDKPYLSGSVHPTDRDQFWALSWLEHHGNWLTVPGGIALGATENLMSPGNIDLIKKVSDLYAEYQKNKITKGEYDARRKAALDQFKQNVGPMERLLFGKRTTHQAIRIARAGGIPATAHIAKHAKELKALATVSKVGGVVLTGVGLTAACMQIANTQDKKKQNEIMVEAVASTAVGIVGGVVVSVFLVSNPIGWGTALVLAVGSAGASALFGMGTAKVYTALGTPADLVTGSGLGQICR